MQQKVIEMSKPFTNANLFDNSRLIGLSLASLSSSEPRFGTPSSSIKIIRTGSSRADTFEGISVKITGGPNKLPYVQGFVIRAYASRRLRLAIYRRVWVAQ